jgi:hypothetical protein
MTRLWLARLLAPGPTRETGIVRYFGRHIVAEIVRHLPEGDRLARRIVTWQEIVRDEPALKALAERVHGLQPSRRRVARAEVRRCGMATD